MSTKELIKILKTFPQDAEIIVGILGTKRGETALIENVVMNGPAVQLTVESEIIKESEKK